MFLVLGILLIFLAVLLLLGRRRSGWAGSLVSLLVALAGAYLIVIGSVASTTEKVARQTYLAASFENFRTVLAGLPRGETYVTTDPRITAVFAALKDRPADLTAFLRAMPKGGDIHSHLSGAVYAENYLKWAEEDGVCVDEAALALTPPPCAPSAGRPSVADLFAGKTESGLTVDRMIDALSVRNFEIYGRSGHDQFFATFGAFDAAGEGRDGDMLAEVMRRAADQNIAYLELMMSPGMSDARKLAAGLTWNDDLAELRTALPDDAIAPIVANTRREIDVMEARARDVLDCANSRPPACDVTVRYLAQVIRVFPAPQVFSQVLFGFRLVDADPRMVGINLVAPEDNPVTLADYTRQMKSIGFAASEIPGVPVSLHAGELTLGLVPPEDLRSHIREAIEIAGARRIGHGVDVLYEDDPEGLLARMARDNILVEINLTSNDVILGVAGDDHPFETYLAAGVPLTLSTDDEGVSRINLTREYVRATRTYDLDYPTLKRFARNSLSHAFLAGESIWKPGSGTRLIAACADDTPGAEFLTPDCADVLAESEKAQLQWQLERDLTAFEETWRAGQP